MRPSAPIPLSFLKRETGGFIPFAPASALRLSIMYLHSHFDNLAKAHAYLTEKCMGRGARFTPDKIAEQHDKLNAYYDAYSKCPGRACATAHNLSGDTPAGHIVGGQLARVDVRTSLSPSKPYYFAWLLTSKPIAWKHQLRMPLIQYFTALDLKCPVQEMAVGMYCHQTGEHQWTQFSMAEIESALEELDHLIVVAETAS